MIVAELYGKLPSKLDHKEDILTSNVFSFFKYSHRQVFKNYLLKIGINITLNESKNAEFSFWPNYHDRTEPDLVIVCGKYYLLFEAKLYSDFSPETINIESQIEREIKMGKMTAYNLNKEFVYIVITAEYYKNKAKYIKYENNDYRFIWSNWQSITRFISDQIESEKIKQDYEFAYDLLSLLIKKRLRSFIGISNIYPRNEIELIDPVFYYVKTSRFKGEFTGFIKNLSDFDKISKYQNIFEKSFFKSFNNFDFCKNQNLFYNYSHE
jgi:hypothetical protein